MTISTDELRAALEPSLESPIVSLERRPSLYRTSHAVEDVDVRLGDGTTLRLLLKVLGRAALAPGARSAKPSFVYDPMREVEVYERLLPGAGVGTARLYGVVREGAGLVIERFDGVELFQVGRRQTWEHVARWLARVHESLASRADAAPRLLRMDRAWLRMWADRAADHATDGAQHLRAISTGYDLVLDRLLALPAGPVHGEFYASNVLVDDPAAPARVCAVDWEMAGIGPQLVDLAALTSGSWTEADRGAIAAEYRRAAPAGRRLADSEFEAGLNACRLHLALQWLGWSQSWSPPAEHRTDWLGEARRMATALGL